MRARFVVLAICLALALTACAGDTDSTGAKPDETAANDASSDEGSSQSGDITTDYEVFFSDEGAGCAVYVSVPEHAASGDLATVIWQGVVTQGFTDCGFSDVVEVGLLTVNGVDDYNQPDFSQTIEHAYFPVAGWAGLVADCYVLDLDESCSARLQASFSGQEEPSGSAAEPTSSPAASDDDSANEPVTPTPEAAAREATEVDEQPQPLVAATWPLIDGVPAFRKAGILVVSGVDYEPVYDADLRQVSASLTLDADRGVFALAPERGEVAFDQIRLGMVEGPAVAWPFVITESGSLTIFTDDGAVAACEQVLADAEPFAAFGIVGDVDGSFTTAGSSCATYFIDEDGSSVGEMETTVGVRSFGVLLSAAADYQPGSTVTIDGLALADTEAVIDGTVRVEVVGIEHAIAMRSEDPSDDASLAQLHILRSDGSTEVIDGDRAGVFEFARSELGSRAKVWVEDYGLEHFVQQGPWIDSRGLTSTLTIDMSAAYGPWDGPPSGSGQHRRPHELQIWNGSSKLEVQQFHGLNWNNNLGQADRDRSTANPNQCARAAWFGGSYVQALQTRVDQKPALIAEALLDSQGRGCHEILSFARSLYSVESHVDNARRMVEDFGVTHLIFAISANELCRMHDEVYSNIFEVAATTPIHWRLVDGDLIAPITRSRAEELVADPDFEASDVCSFGDRDREGAAGAADMIDKLDELGRLMESFGDEVEVSFFLLKDVLADAPANVATILERCLATGHNCVALQEPPARTKPVDLVATDANPDLLRYVGDGHPNPRANQHIAEGLVAIVESARDR